MLTESRAVAVTIDRTFHLTDGAQAVRYVETEHARGKVLLTFGRPAPTPAPTRPTTPATTPVMTARSRTGQALKSHRLSLQVVTTSHHIGS